MIKEFPNDDYCPNEWIIKYNKLVFEIKAKEDFYKEYKKTQPKRNDKEKKYDKNNVGIHHIIPKSLRPDLVKNPDNLLYVPFDKHILLHYYLWKADYRYANQLKFIAAAARSWNICELPGGEETWLQICKDSVRIRKENKRRKEAEKYLNEIKEIFKKQGWYVLEDKTYFIDNYCELHIMKKYDPEQNKEIDYNDPLPYDKSRDIKFVLEIDITEFKDEYPDEEETDYDMYGFSLFVNNCFGGYSESKYKKFDNILNEEYRRELYTKLINWHKEHNTKMI